METGVIVVMGVAGSGKSTVAAELARRLRWLFIEGDAFHPPANVAKMRAATPLTDDDRAPWLDAIAAWIADARSRGERCVVACSALKRAYRERIRAGRTDVRFVYLQGPYDLIARRMAARREHYMPVALLKSQFETLEAPAPDERAIVLSIDRPPESMADEIVQAVDAGGARLSD